MAILRFLALPFAVLYKIATNFRNHLYNIGNKRSIAFDVPVISVGNLIAGGAGKTPMVEYLIDTFSEEYKIATLSRGYGRRTSGFRLANDQDNARTIGDEPFQILLKYYDQVKVAVGAERSVAIPEILFHQPETDLIVLDDAFQHRAVSPRFNLLLTEFQLPFFRDYVLPMGMLRESRKGAARANAVVVTKCPEHLTEETMLEYEKHCQKYAVDKPVFFTSIKYLPPRHFYAGNKLDKQKVILLTGIANALPFSKYMERQYSVVEHFKFHDHHFFTEKELKIVMEKARTFGEDVAVLTTEKDMVRIKSLPTQVFDKDFPIFYQPIKCFFLKDGRKFDNIVRQAIEATREE